MQKPNDPITVGKVTLNYSELLKGWVLPDGTVIKNPIKAQHLAEQINDAIIIH
ncbi:DUF1317 family protein [Pantoea stewartii]|uniref:DUF1317 family protein n=1 Tax=Pantoea stewartii TaxID=66269 RepID=UPI0013903557|nr:DUF1317 family protein [Pantoea stewartii]